MGSRRKPILTKGWIKNEKATPKDASPGAVAGRGVYPVDMRRLLRGCSAHRTKGSWVGLAAMNGWFHQLTGVHMFLYAITDWLELVPFGFMLAFALLGLLQWVRRKKLLRVDADLLLLGGFYLAVLASYLLFEFLAINERPVLIGGALEVSYPSSTTLLVLCVMPTAMMQLHRRIRRPAVLHILLPLLAAFTALMVVGRLISGVHWLSDIIGSILLSAGLVLLYAGCQNRLTA